MLCTVSMAYPRYSEPTTKAASSKGVVPYSSLPRAENRTSFRPPSAADSLIYTFLFVQRYSNLSGSYALKFNMPGFSWFYGLYSHIYIYIYVF